MPVMTQESVNPNSGSDFAPCPEDDYQGVVVDVVDCGWAEKAFNGESKGWHPQLQFVYQVDAVRDDGKPYLVFGRKQFVSFDERANFYKEVCGIIGEKRFKELLSTNAFDPEGLIGANVDLTVQHNESKDGSRIYANISSLKPWNVKRGPIMEPRDYERRCWRDNWVEPDPSAYEHRDSAEAKLGVGMAKPPVAPPQRQVPAQTLPPAPTANPSAAQAQREHRKQYMENLNAQAEEEDDNDPFENE